MFFNLPLPTFGGRQFWTDVRIQAGWRVQGRVGSSRYRLLDRFDVRRSCGDEASQVKAMEDRIQTGEIAPARSKAVVLIHGLGRSQHSLRTLSKVFKADGYEVVDFNYASTRCKIEHHAAALKRLLESLKSFERISFVTHSLGGIVLRQALSETQHMNVDRAVLLTAPNQGSKVARMLTENGVMDAIFGPALRQLANPDLGKSFPLQITFATVAGTANWLPFLKGVNDGLVTVEEAQLDGAREHVIFKASHAFVMNNKHVIAFTREFLEQS